MRRGIDTWLLLVCLTRTGMSLILLTYSASLTLLRGTWGMSAAAAGSVSTGFQVGFALSLFGCSWLADRVGARRVFLASAASAAVAALAFALFARSYLSGLILFTIVGVSQGGTYTTAIMMVADRYEPQRRGAALGWLLAASSLGLAGSLLVSGLTLPLGGYPLAFLATAAGPIVGLVLGWIALRATPNLVHARGVDLKFQTEVLHNARAVRLIVGYVFHSWELLAMWVWTPAFLAASVVAAGSSAGRAAAGAFVASAFHVMGLLASSTMGRLSDRLGRRAVLLGLAATSGACSFIIGWLGGAPAALVVGVGALYAFTALGDSPVLSTALTEAVRPAYLGAALALRSLLGFGAGAVAPLVFGVVLDATNPPGVAPATWGWAFSALGAGGLVATICAYGLRPSEEAHRA
jgi:MFS family permease